jgi:hypothetical protein
VAAGSEPSEEFRFYNAERAEPGSAGVWVRDKRKSRHRHRCEPIDRSFAAGVSGAEFVSIGRGGEPVRVDAAALLGLRTESDRTIWKSSGFARSKPPIIIGHQ